jgi:hypothetical protein
MIDEPGIGADGGPFREADSVRAVEQMKGSLAGFRSIDLNRLDAIKLMRRYDKKFLFHRDLLTTVWSYLRQNYQVLEIGGGSIFSYDNLYYDTDGHLFYHQHHNQRMNRYKLRCRRYLDSGQCFFEVKFKDNRKKTTKNRFLLGSGVFGSELPQGSREFARAAVRAQGGACVDQRVVPSLRIRFNRVTFADLARKERLTFDVNLTYTDPRCVSRRIGNLIVAELKSENPSTGSPFFHYLKGLSIAPSGFSKYCMGIALMGKDVKRNRFKRRLSMLENLM